jgi:hypothetical protein
MGGQTNVYNEERSGKPSAVSDDLVQTVGQKMCKRWHFTIPELLREFPQISRSFLHEIITVMLGYHTRWVPQMLMGPHKTQRMASALTSLERYHKDGDEFFDHIVRVTSNKIWASFVNVETKEQSKQLMHTHLQTIRKV